MKKQTKTVTYSVKYTKSELMAMIAPVLNEKHPEVTHLRIQTNGEYGRLVIRAAYKNRSIMGKARNHLSAINRFFEDVHLKTVIQPYLA